MVGQTGVADIAVETWGDYINDFVEAWERHDHKYLVSMDIRWQGDAEEGSRSRTSNCATDRHSNRYSELMVEGTCTQVLR